MADSRKEADGHEGASVLRTTTLSAGYGHGQQRRAVVDRVSVSLAPGELACLLGPNGAGKSTLLRTITGLQAPLDGHVRLGSDDLHALPSRLRARRLAVVLTDRVTAGLLRVRSVVAMGRHPYTDWRGRLAAEDEAIVDDALEMVGAAALSDRLIAELSDGERQRVMVARALAQQPEILVLDEVTAFLDLPRRVEMIHLLQRLAHEQRLAVLTSTHDLDLALRHADTLWVMTTRGTVHTGWPEALVLTGVLQEAFGQEGTLRFDTHTGEFVRARPDHGVSVLVDGNGPPAVWTGRALERRGLQVASIGSATQTTWRIRVEATAPCWQVVSPSGQSSTFHSLEECVTFVAHRTVDRLVSNGE